MAIVNLVGQMVYPGSPAVSTSVPGLSSSLLLDAADEKAAFVVVAPKTGNIRKIGWATRTVTTGATLDIRLETLSSGFPSGTLWGTTTNGSQVVLDANDDTFFLTQLTADAAVTKGDLLGVVIANPAVGSGVLQVCSVLTVMFGHLPFCALYTGSWARIERGPSVAFEYDDGTYAVSPGCFPPTTAMTSTSIGTGSTPDAVGALFQFPFPCRIVGAWAYADFDAAAAIRLVTTAYNQGAGTGILGSIAIGVDDEASAAAGLMLRLFSSAIDLSANTNYRLIVEPTSASVITAYDFNAPSLAALSAWNGPDWVLTTAKDPTGDGDWTNYNSGTFRYPLMGLLIGGFDAGGGGGGLLTHPGMSGGLRG